MDQSEGRGKHERRAFLKPTAEGQPGAHADGQGDEGFDPWARLGEPAHGYGGQGHAMAEREDQGTSERLRQGGRAEEHREHEQTVIPAAGQHVRETVAEERPGRLVGRDLRLFAEGEFGG